MYRMKFLKSIFAVVTAAIMLSSCGSDEASDSTMEMDYTGCFNYIYNKNLATGVICTGTTYKIVWKGDFTADVYVNNAKFSKAMPDGVNILFKDLKWSYLNGIKCINATNVVPSAVTMNGGNVELSTYVLDKINVEVLERRLLNFTPEYVPVVNISMSKGDVEVITIQKYRLYVGPTEVTNTMSQTKYNSPTKYYAVTLDPVSMEAKIDIYGASFANNMPQFDMTFSGVKFELSNVGYRLNSDNLIPTIRGIKYEKYAITDLVGDGVFASGLDLQFNCKDIYAVDAKLGYNLD